MLRTSEQIQETSRRGLEFYHEQIKPIIGDEYQGSFVAIDAITGEYEIGETEMEVVDNLKKRVPDPDVLVLVHPRIWVHSIGGGDQNGPHR